MAKNRNIPAFVSVMLLAAGLCSAGAAPSKEAVSPKNDKERKANADIEEVGVEEFSDDKPKEVEKEARVTDNLLLEEVAEPESDFHYAAFSRPDPFMPPSSSFVAMLENSVAEADEVAADGTNSGGALQTTKKGFEIPVIHPLQRYKIEELELKGIWKMDNGEKRAMLLTPDKQGVIVKEEDPVSNGKITLIEDKHITVRLYSVDHDGVRKFSDEKMYLGQPPDKKKGIIRLKPGESPEFFIQDVSKVAGKVSNKANDLEKQQPLPAGPDAQGASVPPKQAAAVPVGAGQVVPALPPAAAVNVGPGQTIK